MEDFEFKPLTKGLGFHKTKKNQTEEATESIKWSNPVTEKKGLNLLEEEFTPPLPRTDFGIDRSKTLDTTATAPTLDELIRNLEKNRLPTDKEIERPSAQTSTDLYAFGRTSIGAGFLDGMLILALTLLGYIAFLSITNVDLIRVVRHGMSPTLALASISVLWLMGITYYLAHRTFLGVTPGEWAYEQQIGLPTEKDSAAFLMKMTVRSVLNVTTGFILFPIISILTGKDILGEFTGARLYQRR